MEEKTQPVCFFAATVEDEKSKAHPASGILLREILTPILGEMGFSLVTAHELPDPSMIGMEAIAHLSNDRLVIADLTGLNSNVMYEVGVRHCLRLPLVILAENGTNLPFEIQSDWIFFYNSDLSDREGLRHRLKQLCEKAIADKAPDNPVYRAAKSDITKEAMNYSNALPRGAENLDMIAPRRSRVRLPQRHKMPPPPQYSQDEVFVDWIEAEGDSSAMRNLIDQIGSMRFILASRLIKVAENKTRIEFRHLQKTPSTYIVMKYLTREGFKVTDASGKSEPFIAETGAE
jgi:hypothetical protein